MYEICATFNPSNQSMKKILYFLVISIHLIGCGQGDDSQTYQKDIIVDTELASLYPIAGQWIELQNLSIDKKADAQRSVKNSSRFPLPMQSALFHQWCEGGNCIQINSSNELEWIPREGMESELAELQDGRSFFPVSDGWISISSYGDENFYTVQKWDEDLAVVWTTIYQKTLVDEELNNISFVRLLGYHDDLLVFGTNYEAAPRSGYIQLGNGQKFQREENWAGLLLDFDQATVLGRLIKDEVGDYQLIARSESYHTGVPASQYTANQLGLSEEHILLALYDPRGGEIMLQSVHYRTSQKTWSQQISVNAPIENLLVSSFQGYFLVEVNEALYVFSEEDGSLAAEFSF